MNTKTRHLMVAAAGCTILLASCASSKLTTTHVPMSSSATHADSSLAGTVYAKVNDYRASIGAQPLQRDAGLDRMAQKHSEFLLANRGKFTLSGSNVSHYGFEERALYAQRAMNMQSVAENVASGPWSGQGGPADMVNTWKASSDHNFNLKGNWNATGVGVAVDKDGRVFATQIFATRSTSLMTMANRMKEF
jgi:uncharacterized protein YkwD